MKLNSVPVPAEQPERPTVFVIVTGSLGWGGDVSGALMHADGSVSATHISSNRWWLRSDLTTSFSDRRTALEERYGDEVDVAEIEGWENAPEWLHQANNAWADAQEAAKA